MGDKNNLCFILSTLHSSKRSNRNIDLSLTNIGGAKRETLKIGTSDQWSVMVTCKNLGFDKNTMFSHIH
jgi:hypothetical protein